MRYTNSYIYAPPCAIRGTYHPPLIPQEYLFAAAIQIRKEISFTACINLFGIICDDFFLLGGGSLSMIYCSKFTTVHCAFTVLYIIIVGWENIVSSLQMSGYTL